MLLLFVNCLTREFYHSVDEVLGVLESFLKGRELD